MSVVKTLLRCSVVMLCIVQTALAGESASIYVYREADGTIRFTNRKPGGTVKAQIFTAKAQGISYYRGTGTWRTKRLYPDMYTSYIESASRLHRVDPELIRAVIHAESSFNPHAVSPKGARGLMQLMPGTARDLGLRNSFSPAHNILAGTRYLARLLKKFDGNVEYALAAYNAGEENVSRYGGVPPFAETTAYVRKVLSLKRRYSVACATPDKSKGSSC